MAAKTSTAVTRSLRAIRDLNAVPIRRPFVCCACRIAQPARSFAIVAQYLGRTSQRQTRLQPFSSSSTNLKKSSANPKSQRKSPPIESSSKSEHIPDNQHTRSQDAEPDPYDHHTLQSAIDQALARLKDALSKTRDAGRVSVNMIEDLLVDLPSSSKGQRTRVGDIASVVPRGGRTMHIHAAESGHVKPLQTALQASPYSLTPQTDQQNPLQLTVPVPPATAETRGQAAAEAKKCFDKASLEVRNARGDAQKRHKKMELTKAVVPDELRKAHKGMEDVAKKGQDEVKRVYDTAVKALQNV